MMNLETFNYGERIRHADRPEWGEGVIVKVEAVTAKGQPAQRLHVRFTSAGLKVINTAFAHLVPATAAAETASAAFRVPVVSSPVLAARPEVATAAAGGNHNGVVGAINGHRTNGNLSGALHNGNARRQLPITRRTSTPFTAAAMSADLMPKTVSRESDREGDATISPEVHPRRREVQNLHPHRRLGRSTTGNGHARHLRALRNLPGTPIEHGPGGAAHPVAHSMVPAAAARPHSADANGNGGWIAEIERRKFASAGSGSGTSHGGSGGGSSGQGDPMLRMPEPAVDPFRSTRERLQFSLNLYRFQRDAKSITEWAIAQSGMPDPLTRWSRQELELMFDRWARERDIHLLDLVSRAEKEDPEMTRRLLDAALPDAREALRRRIVRR